MDNQHVVSAIYIMNKFQSQVIMNVKNYIPLITGVINLLHTGILDNELLQKSKLI